MPFTFSHPAIVLPLLYKKSRLLSPSALIIGSLSPDFESFIFVTADKIYGHTWAGMFWFDLPLAFFLYVLFHAVVRQPVIENMPDQLEARFDGDKHFDWLASLKINTPGILLSLMVGIFSHLLWDSFTHLDFRNPDSIHSHVMIAGKRLYIVLQYLSSVAGLGAIGWVVYKMPVKRIFHREIPKFRFWLFMVLLALLIAAVLFTTRYHSPEADMILLIDIAITAGLSAMVIVSVVYKYIFKLEETKGRGSNGRI